MSAQTQQRANTRVRATGARRAMSADQALTRAQERKNSKIDAAIYRRMLDTSSTLFNACS